MKKVSLVLALLFVLFGICSSEAATTVTYVSSEGLYINAGSNAGLEKNDTLVIMRDDQKVATVFIDNISTRSSACKMIEQTLPPQIGDIVVLSDLSEIVIETKKTATAVEQNKTSTAESEPANQTSGYISFQQYYQKDFTSSSLSSYQPSLRTKLTVKNVNGTGLTFQMKHRSRLYHRSKQILVNGDKNEWSHRIFEFAVYADNPDSRWNWSLGRQSIYQVRGIGYIDGLYLSHKLNEKVTVGTAIGGEPNYLDQKIDFNRQKAALFVNYTNGSYETQKLSLSAALAGSYLSGEVNREFVNLSADYMNNKISIYNAVEFDFFRGWRKDALGKSLKFANYYGRINYKLSDKVRFNFGYDNRHQIRYYDDVYLADSLFDNSNHQGIRLGTTLRLSQNITFNSSAGIRFRSDDLDDNKFINGGINFMRFPGRRNSLSLRMAYVKTMFTNAYRPTVSFRFPLFSKMYMTASGSSNIYKTGGNTTTNTYLDLNSYYNFSRVYFLSASLRQYLDSELKSSQLFFELGRSF